jgi:molybdenum cofactor cytidylyltransferase
MRRLAAVVLAAGRGQRFGGAKQLALLDGRPLLVHVLEAVSAARPRGASILDTVVVLGYRAGEIERIIAAARGRPPFRVVLNPDPSRGLASSLQSGLAALARDIDGALVVLGDQPRIRPDVIEAVVDRWDDADGSPSIIVPRYAGGGGRNPALLDRRAWHLADSLTGERGMASLIEADPALALVVDVAGSNPDVDTAADLDAV